LQFDSRKKLDWSLYRILCMKLIHKKNEFDEEKKRPSLAVTRMIDKRSQQEIAFNKT